MRLLTVVCLCAFYGGCMELLRESGHPFVALAGVAALVGASLWLSHAANP